MTQKAKGGRGQKATDPYQRLSVTVPPRLGRWVAEEAQRQGVTRSAVVARALIQAEQAVKVSELPKAGLILKPRGKKKHR